MEPRWPAPSRSSRGDAPCPARACLPECAHGNTRDSALQDAVEKLSYETDFCTTSCVKWMILLCRWRVFLRPYVHVSVCPCVRVPVCLCAGVLTICFASPVDSCLVSVPSSVVNIPVCKKTVKLIPASEFLASLTLNT